MTDACLRAVARAAAQGDPAARAALLLQRVRTGALSAEQLRLAAWLGDDRASAVVGPDLVRYQPVALLPWLLDLTEVGTREAVIRALASVGTSRVTQAGANNPELAVAVSLVWRGIEHPVADTALAKEAARLATRAARGSRRGASPLLLCAWAAHLAASPANRWLRVARKRLTRWAEIATDDPRPAIRQALLPWALGERESDHPINLHHGRRRSRGRMLRPGIS